MLEERLRESKAPTCKTRVLQIKEEPLGKYETNQHNWLRGVLPSKL